MDEVAIRQSVLEREEVIDVIEDWITPNGNLRRMPMYEAHVENVALGKDRVIKGKDRFDVERKAQQQLRKWAEAEIKLLTKEAAEIKNEDAKEALAAIEGVLHATLDVDDRLDWNSMLNHERFEAFVFTPPPPAPLPLVKKPWYVYVLPFLRGWWQRKFDALVAEKRAEEKRWEAAKESAFADYSRRREAFRAAQEDHNHRVLQAKEQYETATSGAVEEYLAAVFERSSYPDGFFVQHEVAYEAESKTAVVDLELPPQSDVPDVCGFKYVASRAELTPLRLKPKQHAELYDSAIKQAVLRTLHEVFESDYAGHVQACVANGFVTAVDVSTGLENRTCVISVSSERAAFEAFDLSRVDPSACIKGLKGLIAGPLSDIAPVKPILQLAREDARFVDNRDVLHNLGDQNIAEMDWEEFEHLVRELCSKMFSSDNAEVRVTQASRDQGVDAIAFDPDPIRGGKFVVQAKRYTKVVPVSAVRDLYGTVINEGATRGILVTTAHYGRESREFAKDKPVTLIDGPNLVHLLNEHGYQVRLDVKAARETA